MNEISSTPNYPCPFCDVDHATLKVVQLENGSIAKFLLTDCMELPGQMIFGDLSKFRRFKPLPQDANLN